MRLIHYSERDALVSFKLTGHMLIISVLYCSSSGNALQGLSDQIHVWDRDK